MCIYTSVYPWIESTGCVDMSSAASKRPESFLKRFFDASSMFFRRCPNACVVFIRGLGPVVRGSSKLLWFRPSPRGSFAPFGVFGISPDASKALRRASDVISGASEAFRNASGTISDASEALRAASEAFRSLRTLFEAPRKRFRALRRLSESPRNRFRSPRRLSEAPRKRIFEIPRHLRCFPGASKALRGAS